MLSPEHVQLLPTNSKVESPWRVGVAFGGTAPLENDGIILPDFLKLEERPFTQFTSGFVAGRFYERGWTWVESLSLPQWDSVQIGQFLAYLPFTPETWSYSSRLLGDDESSYWRNASVLPFQADEKIEEAIDQLIKYDRPNAAIRCLTRMLHDKHPFEAARAVRVLLAALKSKESAQSLDAYETVEVIKAIQKDPNTNPDDLFRVEWAYLPLLDRSQGGSPKTLERKLANDPELFCEIIRLIFKSKKTERKAEEITEQTKNLATSGYTLLQKWSIPPGSQEDGSFDSKALTAWLDAVKNRCSETGHLEVAMTMVGHVLFHTSPDPSGLWIQRAVAEVLNEKDSGDMRNGFFTEILNSRGVYHATGGQAERTLAEHFRKRAEAVELAGFSRLASTVRDVATSYDRNAEREASRDHFDD